MERCELGAEDIETTVLAIAQYAPSSIAMPTVQEAMRVHLRGSVYLEVEVLRNLPEHWSDTLTLVGGRIWFVAVLPAPSEVQPGKGVFYNPCNPRNGYREILLYFRLWSYSIDTVATEGLDGRDFHGPDPQVSLIQSSVLYLLVPCGEAGLGLPEVTSCHTPG